MGSIIHNKVIFDDKKHKYTNALGREYTSVTTLIGKYKPKKDWKAIATAYAKKNGNTASYWLAKWNRIKEDACAVGSDFHDKKENELLEAGEDLHFDKVYKVDSERYVVTLDDYSDLSDGVYTEMLLWHHDYLLAGKADKIIIDGKYVDVDDYKTNKEIDEVSYFHPTKGYEKMLSPLNKINNCTLNHYTLQLSMYAFMMEQWGYTVRNLQFRWHQKIVDNNGNAVISEEPTKIYKIEYKRSTVIRLLTHHLATTPR